MRSLASFGSSLRIIFCLEGNAIFLIKPGSELELKFSVGCSDAI